MNNKFVQIISLALLITLFAACDGGKQDLRDQIAKQEETLKNAPTAEDAQVRSLLTLYVQYIQRHQDDELVPVYLYRMAEIYYRSSNWAEAARHLNMLVEQHPDAPVVEDALIFAGMIYEERLHDGIRAEKAYTLYKEKFPQGKHIQKAELFFKSPEERLLARMDELQIELQKNPNNTQAAQLFAYSCKNFIQQNPANPKAAQFAMLGGNWARKGLHTFLAIELWTTLLEKFPNDAAAPDALYQLGMEHEVNAIHQWRQMQQNNEPFMGFLAKYKNFAEADFHKEAERYYKQLIAQYPQHPRAADAANNLKHIGKNANDIVDSFVAKRDSAK